MTKSITILQLYSKDMNIYGDYGNALALLRRLQWHGYEPQLIEYNVGDDFPQNVDIIVGGGGQDSGQTAVQADLLKIKSTLHHLADTNIPMLLVCGLYQLFGRSFTTARGDTIDGIGLFGMETTAGPDRLVGNIVTYSDQFGHIVGYENHSGKTVLDETTAPFGEVQRGAGNNGQDAYEGARYKNVIGTYLHGSILPKNPLLADYLIEQAVVNKYDEFEPSVIDDRFAHKARNDAIKRPR